MVPLGIYIYYLSLTSVPICKSLHHHLQVRLVPGHLACTVGILAAGAADYFPGQEVQAVHIPVARVPVAAGIHTDSAGVLDHAAGVVGR